MIKVHILPERVAYKIILRVSQKAAAAVPRMIKMKAPEVARLQRILSSAVIAFTYSQQAQPKGLGHGYRA